MTVDYKRHDLFPQNILIREFSGEVIVADIIESWEYFINNKLLDEKVKGVINNLLTCKLNVDMESFNTLMTYMKKQNYLNGVKVAVVCDKPETLVFPMLAEHRYAALQIKPFSSIKAAAVWIIQDLDEL